MRLLKLLLPVTIAGLTSVSFAQYTLTDDGLTYGITGYVNSEHVFLTPINADINGGPQFIAYCVDLADSAAQGQYWPITPVLATSGLTNGADIAKLYNAFAGTANGSAAGQVALQLAIWADLYNPNALINAAGGLSVSVDDSVNYGSTISQANTWLSDTSDLNAASDSATWLKANSHPERTHQDFLTGTSTVPPVPEPCSLLALGGGAIMLMRKRSKR